jgi:hypothetical protein
VSVEAVTLQKKQNISQKAKETNSKGQKKTRIHLTTARKILIMKELWMNDKISKKNSEMSKGKKASKKVLLQRKTLVMKN